MNGNFFTHNVFNYPWIMQIHFAVSMDSAAGWGYTPHPRPGQVPVQDGRGTPNQNSIGWNCCVAGGKPFVFTQEDLLLFLFHIVVFVLGFQLQEPRDM